MPLILRLIIISSVSLWASTLWANPPVTVEGRVDWIEADHLIIGDQKYEVIYTATEKGKADALAYGFETECWVVVPPAPYKIDYTTLIQVGYIEQVRLTLHDGKVRTIEVLDMQQ